MLQSNLLWNADAGRKFQIPLKLSILICKQKPVGIKRQWLISFISSFPLLLPLAAEMNSTEMIDETFPFQNKTRRCAIFYAFMFRFP
jgi:hypothetical protein